MMSAAKRAARQRSQPIANKMEQNATLIAAIFQRTSLSTITDMDFREYS
jgi:chemotaxis regulatin CheY-phosphate phosphatase CheZ